MAGDDEAGDGEAGRVGVSDRGERQKDVTDAYRDGWERIWSKRYPSGWPEEFPGRWTSCSGSGRSSMRGEDDS